MVADTNLSEFNMGVKLLDRLDMSVMLCDNASRNGSLESWAVELDILITALTPYIDDLESWIKQHDDVLRLVNIWKRLPEMPNMDKKQTRQFSDAHRGCKALQRKLHKLMDDKNLYNKKSDDPTSASMRFD